MKTYSLDQVIEFATNNQIAEWKESLTDEETAAGWKANDALIEIELGQAIVDEETFTLDQLPGIIEAAYQALKADGIV